MLFCCPVLDFLPSRGIKMAFSGQFRLALISQTFNKAKVRGPGKGESTVRGIRMPVLRNDPPDGQTIFTPERGPQEERGVESGEESQGDGGFHRGKCIPLVK